MKTPGVPPRWDRTILRCLEKDPGDRFADVEDIPAVLVGSRRLPRRRLGAVVGRLTFWKLIAGLGIAAGLIAIVLIAVWPGLPGAGSSADPVVVRQSVAVLGFENLTGDPDTAWISTALSEVLTTELAAGGAVRTVPNESVAHARAELGIDHVTTLGPDTLGRLRDLLATDLVVLGSYAVFGEEGKMSIRLDSRVQDIGADEIVILDSVTGDRDDLVSIAIGAATEIRRRFGLDVAVDSETSQAFPSDPEAARLYAEGVMQLRSFDPAGARDLLERAAVAEPDSPLIWIELSNAWTELGYGMKALEAAARSKQLSDHLGREARLRIEGQHQLLDGQMDAAVDSFRSLWLVYPDNLEYGLLLADAQVAAGRPGDSLETVAELRTLPEPLSDDPRIDLAEAAAAGNSGDAKLQAAAAERVVAASSRMGSSLLEAQGRLSLGTALTTMGQLDRAVTEIEAARALEAAAGNLPGVAQADYALALTHLAMGEIDAALSDSENSLAMAREVEARITEADALNLVGSIRLHQGDFAAALEALTAALGLQRQLGNEAGEADALNNVALVQMWSGDFVHAVDSFAQVRARYRELGKPQYEAAAVMNLGRIEGARGNLDGARSLFEEAAGLYRAQENSEALAEALFGLGEVLLTRGDLQGARSRHEEALALRRDHQLGTVAESEFALAGLTLAEAALGRRDYDSAVDELSRSVATLAEQKRPALEADALNYLAEAELGAGRVEDARVVLDRIRGLAESANSVTMMVLRINEARLAAAYGRFDDAEFILEKLIAEARTESSYGVEIEARLTAAEISVEAGRVDEARQRLDEVKREAVARGWMLIADKAGVIENRLEGRKVD